VIRGEKEPGSKLLLALANLPGISRRWALHGEGEPFERLPEGLPVADCLLPGPPANHEDLLTGNHEQLKLNGEQLYVVVLREGTEILKDASAGLQPGDRLVVDADASGWRENLRQLHGRLCAVRMRTEIGSAIETKKLYFLVDAHGRQAELAFRAATEHDDWQIIDVDDVVGLVRLVYRYC
jgi:hypothetical protein